MRNCEVRDLGLLCFADAYALQQDLVSRRKEGRIPDQLLFVEHPHVVTMGRNGHAENLLAGEDQMARAGIAFHHTDRGGDVTYHGPGQLVAYPIFDLREWKRDVVAFVRGLEQVVIDALADFSIRASRLDGCTGVWVEGGKICAIGVHLSRWITSHGLALNVDTDLSYFQYIIPCGLTKPVTSMRELGCSASRRELMASMVNHFGRIYSLNCSTDTSLAETQVLETIS